MSEPLASELEPERAAALAGLLARRSTALVECAREHLGDLHGPSLLEGWTRLTVLAHLRYLSEAMLRMTDGALGGRSEAMYPAGRAAQRPGTLELRVDESAEALVESLAHGSQALDERWGALDVEQWETPISDPDHGAMQLSRLVVMRLTETEVHATDLDLPEIGDWDAGFVDAVLPLRVAWLQQARRRPDADLTCDGSWLLAAMGGHSWRVTATGTEVETASASATAAADCRISASPRDLLAILLGRATENAPVVDGDEQHAARFKQAFPGP